MQVYFDNAASTKISEEALHIMNKVMLEDYANPSAKHIKGMEAERYVKDAAKIIAKTLKVNEKEIIFTSGGTESNNMALIGAALANSRNGKHIISSAIEHPAVYNPLSYLESIGFEISIIPVDAKGHILTDKLMEAIREDTIIVSVMHVNNEIGAIEPIEEIAKILHSANKNIIFHVDAIQSYGKFILRPKAMGIDILSVSAHKIHGPKGVGFIYINKDVKIKPIIYGGKQQYGLRSGTLNVPAIAGMAVAIRQAYEDFENRIGHMNSLKDYLIERLSELEGLKLNSYKAKASAPNIISISVSGIKSEVLLHALEQDGIYVSSGSACSSNHLQISGTLKAIGLSDVYLDSTIRVSISYQNTFEEADYFIDSLKRILPMLRKFKRH